MSLIFALMGLPIFIPFLHGSPIGFIQDPVAHPFHPVMIPNLLSSLLIPKPTPQTSEKVSLFPNGFSPSSSNIDTNTNTMNEGASQVGSSADFQEKNSNRKNKNKHPDYNNIHGLTSDSIISSSEDGDDAVGLLYVFSEANKRIPIAELPKRVDQMQDSIKSWSGDAIKGLEENAVNFGETFADYVQAAAGELAKRTGEALVSTYDALQAKLKGVLADWIGCAPPPLPHSE